MEWADEILDDIVPVAVAGSRGLETEIEAYFMDGQVHVDLVKFWQVHCIVAFSSKLTQPLIILSGKSATVPDNILTCS